MVYKVLEEEKKIRVADSGDYDTVKVDAAYGAVEAGDLLTSSPKPGYAMKAASPKIGTIMGKALEPLKSGAKKIAVMIHPN